MTDNNPLQYGRNQQDLDDAALDRELDVVLANLAAAEPRVGLEERILATLRLEQTRAAQPSWWQWPAVAALAGVMLMAVFEAQRAGKPTQNAARHPTATTHVDEPAGTQVADNGSGSIRPRKAESTKRRKPRPITGPARVITPKPKLDQFPSPQPLSEQETILTHYVRNYPEHAALIAQARTEELRRDNAEEMGEPATAGNEISDSRNE